MKQIFHLFIFFTCFVVLSCGRKTASSTTATIEPPQDLPLPAQPTEVDIAQPDLSETPRPIAPYVVLALEKKDCIGICPVYEVRLFSDGRAVYKGSKDVPKIGKYEAKISKDQLSTIVAEIERIRFFEMANAYPQSGRQLNELPSTVITVNLVRRAKSIFNNYDAPKRLMEFEKWVEAFCDGLVWEKIGS